MNTYNVFLQNPVSGDIYELKPTQYSFTEKINLETRADFAFPYHELEKIIVKEYGQDLLGVLSSQRMEIFIERNGTKIMLGAVVDFGMNPVKSGSVNVRLLVMDYFGLLLKRIVGVPKTVYSSIDSSDIAWDLIDDSQNSDTPYSDWGITRGANPTTVNRDRTFNFQKIYDAIIGMSNTKLDNGFDFNMDVNKQFNIYYPTRGANKPNIIFDEITAPDWDWKKPLIPSLTNIVHVLGEGYNDDVNYVTRTAGTGYRSPFGTLESVMNERDTELTVNLNSKGDRLLIEEREPIIGFSVEHFDDLILWSDYGIGDNVKVNYPKLGMVNIYKRVTERTFKMDEKGYVSIKSKLE